MSPEQFIKTVYLGDRACKALLIDSWHKRVAVQIDTISRLRAGTHAWDFYADEDVRDGWLVFTGVCAVQLVPSGPLPNDLINELTVKRLDTSEGHAAYLFEISIGAVDKAGTSAEVHVCVEADDVHIEDPKKPGERIR